MTGKLGGKKRGMVKDEWKMTAAGSGGSGMQKILCLNGEIIRITRNGRTGRCVRTWLGATV